MNDSSTSASELGRDAVTGGLIGQLPEEKGAYILLVWLPQMKRLEVGRLGGFQLAPGYYAYVGSAHGPGGLRGRLQHHLEAIDSPHWHIDYLLQWARPVEVWYAVSDRKLEHDWAELLAEATAFRVPIPRFGSSDYHRSTTTHLFFSKRRPSFRWFQRQLVEAFEPDIRAGQLVLA